jgi:hypothetical protein
MPVWLIHLACSLRSRSAEIISRLKNTVGWFFVREKYCSGWKNKLNKTNYKPDEQGLHCVWNQVASNSYHQYIRQLVEVEGHKHNVMLLMWVVTICWAIWLVRNDAMFSICHRKTDLSSRLYCSSWMIGRVKSWSLEPWSFFKKKNPLQ